LDAAFHFPANLAAELDTDETLAVSMMPNEEDFVGLTKYSKVKDRPNPLHCNLMFK
jgi:hypothetical protein